MCRRRVPMVTTSSSPFLNKPTSPFAAKGSRSRTLYCSPVFSKREGRFGLGDRRRDRRYRGRATRARSSSRSRPRTSWVNSGTRFTGMGAKYAFDLFDDAALRARATRQTMRPSTESGSTRLTINPIHRQPVQRESKRRRAASRAAPSFSGFVTSRTLVTLGSSSTSPTPSMRSNNCWMLAK